MCTNLVWELQNWWRPELKLIFAITFAHDGSDHLIVEYPGFPLSPFRSNYLSNGFVSLWGTFDNLGNRSILLALNLKSDSNLWQIPNKPHRYFTFLSFFSVVGYIFFLYSQISCWRWWHLFWPFVLPKQN